MEDKIPASEALLPAAQDGTHVAARTHIPGASTCTLPDAPPCSQEQFPQ